MSKEKKNEMILVTAIMICFGFVVIFAFCASSEILDIDTAKNFMLPPLVLVLIMASYYQFFRNVHPIWIGIFLSIITFIIPSLIIMILNNSGVNVDNLLGIPLYLISALFLKYFEMPIIKFLVGVLGYFQNR